MHFRSDSATRRNFILASSAQVLFASNPNIASAQSQPAVLDQQAKENLNRIIESMKFASPSQFSQVFFSLWRDRIVLTLARVEADVDGTLTEILPKRKTCC